MPKEHQQTGTKEKSLGRLGKQDFEVFTNAKVKLSKIREFFKTRRIQQPEFKTIDQLLGAPVEYQDGWHRLPWLKFNEEDLSENCEYSDALCPGKSEWAKAYHGTHIEALYATMCDGHLRASDSTREGTRFAKESFGVYLHGLDYGKANSYVT